MLEQLSLRSRKGLECLRIEQIKGLLLEMGREFEAEGREVMG